MGKTLVAAALALALVACGDAGSGEDLVGDAGDELVDAAAETDGGEELDAGLDGGELLDGGPELDAGVDSGPDAGAEPDAGDVDGGVVGDAGPMAECSLVTQAGCGPTQACKRSRGEVSTSPPSGPPECVPTGNQLDWVTGRGCNDQSSDPDDRCRRGMFCQSFDVCVRFCDPAGAPCPDTWRGTPQRCSTDGPGIDPYCTI